MCGEKSRRLRRKLEGQIKNETIRLSAGILQSQGVRNEGINILKNSNIIIDKL